MVKNLPAMPETWVQSLGQENPLEKETTTRSSILAWEIPRTEELRFIVQLSHPYMTTGKTIALTRWTFVDKVMSLLFNMLSRLVITLFFFFDNYVLIKYLV